MLLSCDPPAVFMQNIAVIEQSYKSGDWEAVAKILDGGNLGNPLCRFPDRIPYLLPFVGSDHTGFF